MHLFLVRHGAAGSRHKWNGPDRLRPLSVKGERQAKALVPVVLGQLASGVPLSAAQAGPPGPSITRVLSSPYIRCIQTVEPLAHELGLKVEPARPLAEGAKPRSVTTVVRGLHDPAVLCSHGDVVPLILETLAREDGFELPAAYLCQKGSTWHLVGDDDRYMEAHYIPPPA
jgi:8-oxo-dGTP diphosphatase